ncbi:unnamed protein product [Rotaria socialis]|uniref:Uncharacterized protein n=4 Tax=Rotaria socialis TaxID=392032 RepID=A0A820YSR6_9BILA|nr:unnamed protein product [Rotaria socialis]CAF4547279.1 unnamed protein product [Rotaria socialis]
MIDWLAIAVALAIIATLVGFFGFLAWKINMSDSLTMDDGSPVLDGINEKKKKDKTSNELAKKKRKDQKKPKRENKDDEQQQRQKVKEPTSQTNEDSDDEREESEQELLKATLNNVETSSKARKRNKNKTATSAPIVAVQVEVKTKDEKAPNTTRAPPVTHPKSIAKDELESSKQQAKAQGKVIELPKKQIFPASSQQAAKKAIQTQPQEQPFTVVGGNRNKTTTPPLQQQQPQNKLQVNAVPSSAPVQPSSSSPVQHEQLIHRQPPPQKETPGPVIVVSTNTMPVKQQQKIPAKVADLIKVLPSSQVVVTELMSALDAFPLSTDELDIIMHKIANKQSVLRQDWSKLTQGKKVDPQAHIGQVMDESAKAYEDEIKTNSMKRIKELTDELNGEKHRSNVLLKEKTDKELEIQMLHAQLDSVQHKHEPTNVHPQQRQQMQTIELQVKRLTEENIHLNHQLTQQLSTSKLIQTGDSSNLQVQVLSDQIKKLSVDNGHLEKKVKSNELLAKEAQQEKENLNRYNEQLTQSLQKAEKDLKHVEEKHHKKFNEMQTLNMNEINEYKSRVEKLEKDNEQLRHEEIVHVEPTAVTDIQTITLNSEEREQLEKEIQQLKQTIDLNQENERESNDLKQKLIQEIEEYKNKIENSQAQYQSKENELQKEIEQLKQLNTQQQQQTNDNELAAKNTELSTLQAELDEAKSTVSQLEERQRQQREKNQQILTELLPSDIRNQLSNDNQDFDQWLSSYQQIFQSSQTYLQEQATAIKNENEQLHENMKDIESQLRNIEEAVQCKEEALLAELKSKDAILESIHNENDQLTGELQRLRNEIQRLQSAYDNSVSEISALKLQLDDRFLLAANTPSVDSDQSFEIIKHPLPSLAALVIDVRAEQVNELIRSGKEALEHQESITQQLDKHLNDMHPSGTGETQACNADEPTVLPSTDQQS